MKGSRRSCGSLKPRVVRCASFRGVMPHYGELGLVVSNTAGPSRSEGSAKERLADITMPSPFVPLRNAVRRSLDCCSVAAVCGASACAFAAAERRFFVAQHQIRDRLGIPAPATRSSETVGQ